VFRFLAAVSTDKSQIKVAAIMNVLAPFASLKKQTKTLFRLKK